MKYKCIFKTSKRKATSFDATLPIASCTLVTSQNTEGVIPGTPRGGCHCVYYSGDDDGLAQDVASIDCCFLDDSHFLRGHIQTQVASAKQNCIGFLCYTLKVDQRLPILNLQLSKS